MSSTRSKHIVVVAGYAPSLINFRGRLLQDLVAAGYRVTAVAPEDDERVRQQLQAWNVVFHAIPMQRSGMSIAGDLRLIWAYRKLFKRLRVDILFAYTIKPVIFGSIAGKLAGIPKMVSMITGLGYAFSEHAPWYIQAISRFLYRTALTFNQTVIFQNPDDQQLFVKQRLMPLQKSKIVNGSGIDTQHFAHHPLPPAPVRFLLIARLLREKGVGEYVEAARIVKTRFPEAQFNLLGPLDPSPNGITEEELERWKSEGIIQYLGSTNDVRPYLYDHCSVYVLPSYYREGTPRSILEALSVGRPVITADSPGCRETVLEGQNGFLVPPRNAVALAEAMMKLIEDPAMRTRMAEASRTLAEEKYAIEKVNAFMLGVLK